MSSSFNYFIKTKTYKKKTKLLKMNLFQNVDLDF